VTGAPLNDDVAESDPQPLIIPQEAVQVTPWFVGSLLTVAANFCVRPSYTVAVEGDIETVRGGGGGGGELADPPPQPEHAAPSITASRNAKNDASFLGVMAIFHSATVDLW